ncbi:ABC transporter permease [Haloplasma contractile]|uniref:Inner membrane component of binding-protein-dependent transport system n=1 Tax=Haloplasma contractile SSD-17B TaxID=1033810 RepID=U2FJI3_9MOLU|nr:iron ABC transporter permease [Haloplasma contractile]ERJ11419.1 Putative inner membrane component of binding-protein-dependent transport system [Haloplasma contractile SSD-17B]
MFKLRDLKTYLNIWFILSLIAVLLVILPTANIMMRLFEQPSEVWFHIKEHLLPYYIKNTLIIIISTGFLSAIIGVSLAWVVTMYEFPLRRTFEWGLILPLAIPPYIAAYTYSEMVSYTGVVQTTARHLFQVQIPPHYLDIMSVRGTIFIFTLFLYPYVYIISKSFLQKQSSSLIESARVLGKGQLSIFLKVGVPLLRNAIIGGVILVILEVLNDYGVVHYFGVRTFSTAIFTAWRSFGDILSAVRLSGMLLVLVIIILILEKLLRSRKSYSYTNTVVKPIHRIELNGYKKTLTMLFPLFILGAGFIIPTLQLIAYSINRYQLFYRIDFIYVTINSVTLALTTTIIILLIAIIIANYSRNYKSTISRIFSRIITIGYSIPGAIIAIAVMLLFISIDDKLYSVYQLINPDSKKLLLSFSIYSLIFAYTIRFMAIGYNSIEAGFDKVGNKFSEASRTLGNNLFKTLIKVDFPMIKFSIFNAAILVFIDVLKELPLTLILRPFNYDTLATKAYDYAGDEMIEEASIPSLIIIVVSALAIYFFYKVGESRVRKH